MEVPAAVEALELPAAAAAVEATEARAAREAPGVVGGPTAMEARAGRGAPAAAMKTREGAGGCAGGDQRRRTDCIGRDERQDRRTFQHKISPANFVHPAV